MLIQVTLSDGTSNSEKNITKYFYNNAGVQTKMYTGLNSESDSDYMTTIYEYDRWGRLVRTTDSTGYNSGTITYDLNGNVLTTTDANGNVTTNTYDALNRVLTSETVSDDTSKNVSKSYTYDNMGRITNTISNDLTTTYTYDELGRKSTESEYNNDGYSVFRGYFYEGVSQYVSQELTGQYHLLLYSDKTYEYDDEMRIIKVLESGNETASYTYDANGNKASETLANGVVSTYSYNNANRITKLVTKSGETTISEYEYSYYLDGSDSCKIRKENGIIETTSYEYDSLKRLTQETISRGSTVVDTYSYEYDDYGNRSKMTASGTADYTTVYDYNDADGNYTTLLQKEIKTVENEAETASASVLASNPADLLNTVSSGSETEETVYSYDANGNQITKETSEKTETYTYDGLNQLIGFTDGDTTVSYAYNVSGLRIEKTVDGETINHVWDGSKQIVADIVDNDFYEADCYLRGTNLVAKYNYCNGVKSEYTYYTQNAHGDVVNLTDETGAVTKSYTYDAFGVEQNIDDSDTNAFRYCGEYFDAETGTVYLRARYYDPSIGRFISRDSYAGKNEEPLSLNRYTYCSNNPIIFIDPNGNYGVIIYGTYPGEDGTTKDNVYQAGIIEEEFKDKYGECQVYSVNSAQEFVDTWNSLDDLAGIDEIEFIGHGSVSKRGPDYGIGYLYFGDDSRLYSSSYFSNNNGSQSFDRSRRACGFNDKTMTDLYRLNVGKIYFSACNTANPDFKTNIAQAFAQNNPHSLVSGWDGGVYFRRTRLRFLTVNEDEAMGMKDQPTFKYFKDPSDKRKPGMRSYMSR